MLSPPVGFIGPLWQQCYRAYKRVSIDFLWRGSLAMVTGLAGLVAWLGLHRIGAHQFWRAIRFVLASEVLSILLVLQVRSMAKHNELLAASCNMTGQPPPPGPSALALLCATWANRAAWAILVWGMVAMAGWNARGRPG